MGATAMNPGVKKAIVFTHIIARVSPSPGSYADRAIVNAARRVSRELSADGHDAPADLPPCPLPETASGIPITRRNP